MRRCAICGAEATGTVGLDEFETDACDGCGSVAGRWFVKWVSRNGAGS